MCTLGPCRVHCKLVLFCAKYCAWEGLKKGEGSNAVCGRTGPKNLTDTGAQCTLSTGCVYESTVALQKRHLCCAPHEASDVYAREFDVVQGGRKFFAGVIFSASMRGREQIFFQSASRMEESLSITALFSSRFFAEVLCSWSCGMMPYQVMCFVLSHASSGIVLCSSRLKAVLFNVFA